MSAALTLNTENFLSFLLSVCAVIIFSFMLLCCYSHSWCCAAILIHVVLFLCSLLPCLHRACSRDGNTDQHTWQAAFRQQFANEVQDSVILEGGIWSLVFLWVILKEGSDLATHLFLHQKYPLLKFTIQMYFLCSCVSMFWLPVCSVEHDDGCCGSTVRSIYG